MAQYGTIKRFVENYERTKGTHYSKYDYLQLLNGITDRKYICITGKVIINGKAVDSHNQTVGNLELKKKLARVLK